MGGLLLVLAVKDIARNEIPNERHVEPESVSLLVEPDHQNLVQLSSESDGVVENE